jgi:hypothetical protein
MSTILFSATSENVNTGASCDAVPTPPGRFRAVTLCGVSASEYLHTRQAERKFCCQNNYSLPPPEM